MLWSNPWPDVSSPGFQPAALRRSPSLQTWEPPRSSAICPSIHHPICPPSASYVRPCSQPGAPALHGSGFVTGHGGASQRAAKGGLQTVLAALPSDSPKLWLCSSTCTGSLRRSDVRWPRADLQPHSSPSSDEWQLLGPVILPYQPSLPMASKLIKRSIWGLMTTGASFFGWLPDCKEIHTGSGVRLDQAKFPCTFISAQIILILKKEKTVMFQMGETFYSKPWISGTLHWRSFIMHTRYNAI